MCHRPRRLTWFAGGAVALLVAACSQAPNQGEVQGSPKLRHESSPRAADTKERGTLLHPAPLPGRTKALPQRRADDNPKVGGVPSSQLPPTPPESDCSRDVPDQELAYPGAQALSPTDPGFEDQGLRYQPRSFHTTDKIELVAEFYEGLFGGEFVFERTGTKLVRSSRRIKMPGRKLDVLLEQSRFSGEETKCVILLISISPTSR